MSNIQRATRNCESREVMQWLEWLRQKGEDYSFLRTLPDGKDKRIREILACLDRRYRPLDRLVKGGPRQYIPPESRINQKQPTREEFNRLKDRLRELEKKI